jgi:serine/threonine protein kinase
VVVVLFFFSLFFFVHTDALVSCVCTVVSDYSGSNSDVWSFGLTIMELATGMYPYFKKGPGSRVTAPSTFIELLQSIQMEASPALSTDEFSENICDFVAQSLVKDSETRPSSMSLLVCRVCACVCVYVFACL